MSLEYFNIKKIYGNRVNDKIKIHPVKDLTLSIDR